MAKNIFEATADLSVELGISVIEVIDGDIIFDIEAEEGDDFCVWQHTDGHIAKQGESIGFNVIDGVSEIFTPYEQYTEVE